MSSLSSKLKYIGTSAAGALIGIAGTAYMINTGLIVSLTKFSGFDLVKYFLITRTMVSIVWLLPTALLGLLLFGWEVFSMDMPIDMPVARFLARFWPVSLPVMVLLTSHFLILITQDLLKLFS